MYTLLNWMVKMKFKDKKVLFCLMLFFGSVKDFGDLNF